MEGSGTGSILLLSGSGSGVHSMTEVGRKLRIRQPTVNISAKRGEQIAKERGYYLAK